MIKKIINLGGLNALSQGFYRLSILLIYMFSTSSNMKDFAVNSTLITFLVVFQSLGVAGLSLAANTYIPKFEEKENIYAKVIISISFVLALVVSVAFLFSINPLLDKVLGGIGSATVNYQFLAIFIFILCFSGVFKGFYYAKEKINYLVVTSFFSAISLLSGYFLFDLNLLNSYLISILFEFLFLTLFLLKILDVQAIFKVKASSLYYKELFAFIVPASASGIVLMPVNMVVLYILGFLNSVVVISVFNYGMQIRNLIIFIPSVLGSIFLKILSESNTRNNFFYMLLINFLISVGASLFLIFLKALGFSYIELISLNDLVILCLGSILFSINSVIGNKIISLLKTKVGFYFNVIWAVSFILFTYLSIVINLVSPFLGLLCAYIVLTIIQFLYVRKYLDE
ncbi:hypothetical protein BEN74_10460 [Acinetobacter sp. WCHAc010034]|uniref:hypothetical protein n=1 Tax=Acinetobacter sp. WCHAc010034 TaxID=1879049 RepID=UPI00083B96AD|nr:hypothetical protein [Acinetobacter sp. WCHAc010034]AYA03213.1 hypothetical protein BEN74_10460 [Acinetobacter sp. WCHAc010034]